MYSYGCSVSAANTFLPANANGNFLVKYIDFVFDFINGIINMVITSQEYESEN